MANRRGAKKIDFLSWGGFSFTAGGQAAGSIAATMLSSSLTPYTLMRTRGNLTAYLDGVAAPGKGIIVSVGMHLVPDGTGTTVLVEPFADSATKWFFYREFFLGYEEMVNDVVDVPGITSFRSVIDDKSMRKVAPEQEVQVVFTNTTALTASAANYHISARFLFGR